MERRGGRRLRYVVRFRSSSKLLTRQIVDAPRILHVKRKAAAVWELLRIQRQRANPVPCQQLSAMNRFGQVDNIWSFGGGRFAGIFRHAA